MDASYCISGGDIEFGRSMFDQYLHKDSTDTMDLSLTIPDTGQVPVPVSTQQRHPGQNGYPPYDTPPEAYTDMTPLPPSFNHQLPITTSHSGHAHQTQGYHQQMTTMPSINNPQFPPQNLYIPSISQHALLAQTAGYPYIQSVGPGGPVYTSAGLHIPSTHSPMMHNGGMLPHNNHNSYYPSGPRMAVNHNSGSPVSLGSPSPNSEDSDDATSLGQMNRGKRPTPDIQENNKKKTKVTKKNKKKKDPNEPSKPVSAYALFFRDTQAAIKGSNPNASFGEVSKIVASMWDSLDADNKGIYKKKTEAAKKEYLKALAAYRASLVSKGEGETFNPPFGQYGPGPSYGYPPTSAAGHSPAQISPMAKKSPLLSSLMTNEVPNMMSPPMTQPMPPSGASLGPAGVMPPSGASLGPAGVMPPSVAQSQHGHMLPHPNTGHPMANSHMMPQNHIGQPKIGHIPPRSPGNASHHPANHLSQQVNHMIGSPNPSHLTSQPNSGHMNHQTNSGHLASPQSMTNSQQTNSSHINSPQSSSGHITPQPNDIINSQQNPGRLASPQANAGHITSSPNSGHLASPQSNSGHVTSPSSSGHVTPQPNSGQVSPQQNGGHLSPQENSTVSQNSGPITQTSSGYMARQSNSNSHHSNVFQNGHLSPRLETQITNNNPYLNQQFKPGHINHPNSSLLSSHVNQTNQLHSRAHSGHIIPPSTHSNTQSSVSHLSQMVSLSQSPYLTQGGNPSLIPNTGIANPNETSSPSAALNPQTMHLTSAKPATLQTEAPQQIQQTHPQPPQNPHHPQVSQNPQTQSHMIERQMNQTGHIQPQMNGSSQYQAPQIPSSQCINNKVPGHENEWEQEFASNQSVNNHCRNVYQDWVDSQTPETNQNYPGPVK